VNNQIILTQELEMEVARRNALLQDQGVQLASFAQARWYNEGEHSNKYFLKFTKEEKYEWRDGYIKH
jgi:hypothetical protein